MQIKNIYPVFYRLFAPVLVTLSDGYFPLISAKDGA
jgi:hypothetical protein